MKIMITGLGSGGLGGGGATSGARVRYKPHEEDFLDARREERERIGQVGVACVWGKSPVRPEWVCYYIALLGERVA